MATPFTTAFNVELYSHDKQLENPIFCAWLQSVYQEFDYKYYRDLFWGLYGQDYDPAKGGGMRDGDIVHTLLIPTKGIEDDMIKMAKETYEKKMQKERLFIFFTKEEKNGEPHLGVHVSLRPWAF